jgi:glycine cleavage system H protein
VNLDVKPGDQVTAGKAFGTIESVKTLSDLFAPVTGKVLDVNKSLDASPELVNEDPYGKAWMVVIEASDAGAIGQLLDEKAYTEHVKASAH